MWFIGVEVEQESSATPPKKIPDPWSRLLFYVRVRRDQRDSSWMRNENEMTIWDNLNFSLKYGYLRRLQQVQLSNARGGEGQSQFRYSDYWVSVGPGCLFSRFLDPEPSKGLMILKHSVMLTVWQNNIIYRCKTRWTVGSWERSLVYVSTAAHASLPKLRLRAKSSIAKKKNES